MQRFILLFALAFPCFTFIGLSADHWADLDDATPEILKYQEKISRRVKAGMTMQDAVKAIKDEEGAKPRSYNEHKHTEGIIDTAAKNANKSFNPPGPLASIHIRNAFDGDGLEKAAVLAYQHTPDSDVFSVDAAIIFDVAKFDLRSWDLELQFSTDLKLSSEEKKAPNRIKSRATSILYRPELVAAPAIGLTDMIIYASALHETDRDFATQNVLAEILLRPEFAWGSLRLNAQTNLTFGSSILGRYEIGPLFGFEGGTTVRDSKSLSPENGGFLRPLARVSVSFTPNILKHKLSFSFNDTVRFLSDDDYRSRNLLGAGVEYQITDNIGLALAYSYGYDAPKFQKEEALKLGLGVKF